MGRPNYERVLCILRDGVEDVEREKKMSRRGEEKRRSKREMKNGGHNIKSTSTEL